MMVAKSFNDRIARIQKNGPSVYVEPGPVEAQGRKKPKRSAHVKPGKRWKAIIAAGMMGGLAGLFFKHVVGTEQLLALPATLQLEAALTNDTIAAAFAVMLLGPAMVLLTLPVRKRIPSMVQFSYTYLMASVGANLTLLMSPYMA